MILPDLINAKLFERAKDVLFEEPCMLRTFVQYVRLGRYKWE